MTLTPTKTYGFRATIEAEPMEKVEGHARYRLTKTQYARIGDKRIEGSPSVCRIVDGVAYWEIQGTGQLRLLDLGICAENAVDQLPEFDREKHFTTYEADTRAFFAEYRNRNANRVLSTEERAEILNEIGPDAIDVITGQRLIR